MRPSPTPRQQPLPRNPPGFTLIELLVVILVLGVLASLLLAAASRPLALARAVACRNHLRTWGLATQLYADDHDDRLPPEGFPNPTERHTNQGWYVQLPRQIQLPRYHDNPWRTNPAASTGNTPWLCPANNRRSNGNNLFHYCLNQHVDGTSAGDSPVTRNAIPEPSLTPWLFDSKNLPAVGSWNFTHTNLHSGGAHFLFLDGHVNGYSSRTYWDPDRNRPRTNPSPFRWIP
ncbi:MAG: DUF1559 domain-containing protein [Limisphaerales bacterium]